MAEKRRKKVNWTVKIYFLLISLGSFVAFVILYSTAVYATVKHYITTEEEYQWRNYRRAIENCSETKIPSYIDGEVMGETNQELSEEEIAECEEKERNNAMMERKIDYKESLVTGLLRGTILLLVFIVHFPIFLKINKEE